MCEVIGYYYSTKLKLKWMGHMAHIEDEKQVQNFRHKH
jgi:hypothetical protein